MNRKAWGTLLRIWKWIRFITCLQLFKTTHTAHTDQYSWNTTWLVFSLLKKEARLMESPLLPNLITSRQLKQFCVFCFRAPLKQQHLDNFNYHFNSVKCTKVESLVTNDGSLPYCFSYLLTGGFIYFLWVLGEVTTRLKLLVLPGNVETRILKEGHTRKLEWQTFVFKYTVLSVDSFADIILDNITLAGSLVPCSY